MKITELEVWKAALDLAQAVYELTEEMSDRSADLGHQARQTVVYVPANIAAAASRKYGQESLKYLAQAKASLYEVETMLYLAERMEYITQEQLDEIIETLDTSRRLLFGFIKYYKRSSSPEDEVE